jgi:hypothetical protein
MIRCIHYTFTIYVTMGDTIRVKGLLLCSIFAIAVIIYRYTGKVYTLHVVVVT